MEEGEHQYNVVKVGQILLWKWQIQKFLTQILGQDRDSCPGGARLGRSEQCPQWIQCFVCWHPKDPDLWIQELVLVLL